MSLSAIRMGFSWPNFVDADEILLFNLNVETVATASFVLPIQSRTKMPVTTRQGIFSDAAELQ